MAWANTFLMSHENFCVWWEHLKSSLFFFLNWGIVALGFPGGSVVKESTCKCRRHRQMQAQSPGSEDPLEEVMATHSSILARRIPWTEEPGGLQSIGLQSNTTEAHSCFTMSCHFLLYNKVNQLYVYIYFLPLKPPTLLTPLF